MSEPAKSNYLSVGCRGDGRDDAELENWLLAMVCDRFDQILIRYINMRLGTNL